MMTANTMSAAASCVIPRIPPTGRPTWQTMICTNRQFQIRLRLTSPNPTSRRRQARIPRDSLTPRVRRPNRQGATRKILAKQTAHVVPNPAGSGVEVVRQNHLADIGLEEAARGGCDFERDAARRGIAVEGLAVRGVFGECVLRADAAAYGPEVDGVVALVCDDGAADRGLDAGDGGDEEGDEQRHVVYFFWTRFRKEIIHMAGLLIAPTLRDACSVRACVRAF